MAARIDKELLHLWLWENRGRHGIIPFTQADISRKLGISQFHLNRLFRDFAKENKVKLIKQRRMQVLDPATCTKEEFEESNGNQ